MKSRIIVIVGLFCCACSSTPTKPNCAELKKACSQAQEVCEAIEDAALIETKGLTVDE